MPLKQEPKGLLITRNHDYEAHFEPADGRWWVHLEVFRWSPRVLRRLRVDLADLSRCMAEDLWVLSPDPASKDPSEKFHRFVMLCGWQEMPPEPDHAGVMRRTYTRKCVQNGL